MGTEIKIKRHWVHFKKAKNKVKAIYHLKEILFLLSEEKNPKSQLFLKIIQKELNFQLGKTHWKKFSINCPEIGLHGVTVNKCLFTEEKLKEKIVYAPDNSRVSTWDYINKKINLLSENYLFLYISTVA